ncbi:restriction endonuclease subunit S [Corynebacterium striatum]|uniref:restriction endonuclease subunit S n=2 Tax=Corynebacterium striatum TaxID=43770 RepID=UPI0009B9684E|nr:restriction endonuclease subunit S [Corynebacterium striatum]MDK8882555.1 restriction endonuclease subunit S [Corynebacterium striatum]
MISSGWRKARIGEIAEVKGGKRLPAGYYLQATPTHRPYIRVADMRAGGVDQSDIKYVPEGAISRIQNYRIYIDDIFISVAGTLGIVGRVPISLDGANLTENADRLTNIKCDVAYLMYALQSNPIQDEIDSIRTVGAQPKLALSRIRSFEILMPSDQAEQSRVSRALSDTDDLIESLERLISKKQAIKQGMMQELLTGRTRLSGFTKPWKNISIARHSHLKARIGWQGLTTGEYLQSGSYKLIGGTDFRNARIDWESASFVSKWRFDQDRNIQLRVNDVLITKDGTIGKVAIVDALPFPATLNSGVFVVRPIQGAYESRFLYWLLRSSAFENFIASLSAGSTINHLYQKDLITLTLAFPEDASEQREISSVLDDAESEIRVLEARLETARNIKQGMMQELLSGRTRLSVPEVSS